MRRVGWAGLAAIFVVPVWMGAATPSRSKVHGFTVSGTVGSVDNAKKMLVVTGATGKATTLVWTNATSVFGGKLAAGQAVTVRYLDRDGKHVVTSIRIAPPSAAVTPYAIVPTPSPTAGRIAPAS